MALLILCVVVLGYFKLGPAIGAMVYDRWSWIVRGCPLVAMLLSLDRMMSVVIEVDLRGQIPRFVNYYAE